MSNITKRNKHQHISVLTHLLTSGRIKKRAPTCAARFPSKVVNASSHRLPLRPASANTKMGGNVVMKGRWKNKRLFYVALVEGKTCPASCIFGQSGLCNAADYLGFRFRVNRSLYVWIERQLVDLLRKHPEGIVVRLHVSGDFANDTYVLFWASLLAKYKGLHVWGHTHREGAMLQLIHARLNLAFPERALIRASESDSIPWTAVAAFPIGPIRKADGVVCPGTLTKSPSGPMIKRPGDPRLATCATCAQCMDPRVRKIVWPLIINGVGYLEQRADRLKSA